MIIFSLSGEKMIGSFQHSVGNRIRNANKRHTLEKAYSDSKESHYGLKDVVVFPMKNNVS